MIPQITTPWGSLSTFVICATIGVLVLLILVHLELITAKNMVAEENYIYPKIVISAVIGLMVSGLADSLFKYLEYGVLKISGITFYGGLIGSCVAMFFCIRLFPRNTEFTIIQWFDILTLPLISFHIFGRIGCFLAGCCYGKTTQSWLGFLFPDNLEQGIIHNGLKCYPTQLFEVFALLIIAVIIYVLPKHKFEVYLLLYSVSRFFIEFLRGDDRGYVSDVLSPSQLISMIIVILVWLIYLMRIYKGRVLRRKLIDKFY